MPGVNHTLRGSTLVETLVMMLVAGIVFLAVIQGLTLFFRLQAKQAEVLLANGRRMQGYCRFVELVDAADSVRMHQAGILTLYGGGRQSELALRDSTLIFSRGEFCDTLLDEVGTLQSEVYETRPDTVTIGLRGGFTARFPVAAPQRLYDAALEQIETGHDYEE